MAHNAQERYSSLVLAKIRKENKLKNGVVFNTDYEGSPKAGSVKIPVRDTEVQVSDYDKANGITAGTGSTTYETFTINKDKAVNEIIDDFMEAKEHLNTVCKLAKRMNSKNVPVVKEIIDAYLDFFVKADAICMTVARYARNINREAEKTLGHKSNLQKTIGGNNKNTYLYMQKTLAEE